MKLLSAFFQRRCQLMTTSARSPTTRPRTLSGSSRNVDQTAKYHSINTRTCVSVPVPESFYEKRVTWTQRHSCKPNYCHLEVFGVLADSLSESGSITLHWAPCGRATVSCGRRVFFWWRRGDSGAAVRRAWCDVMCMDDRMITFHGRAVVCSDCSLQRRASKSDCGRRKCCPRAGPDELSREKAATWTARAASLSVSWASSRSLGRDRYAGQYRSLVSQSAGHCNESRDTGHVMPGEKLVSLSDQESLQAIRATT